ncbi:MAG: thioredoxin domain-containing protein [archaeon]|jgi:thiol-disulfide isomerase/thioredoxin|nr:thioredoxin domain-containing protein [archaeon]
MAEKEENVEENAQVGDEDYLLDFYGTECTHCHEMDPLTERLQKEEGVKIKKIEVWHNAQNAAYLQELDQGKCGGVPYFYNLRTKKGLCGAVKYEKLKEWALEEPSD